MNNEDPLDEDECVEDESKQPSQSNNSDKTRNRDSANRVFPEPRIEGWVTSTLSDVISSLNDDKLRALLRDIQQRKNRFHDIE